MKNTKKYLLAFTFLLVLLLVACGGESNVETSADESASSESAIDTESSSGELFRVGIDVDAGTMDPRLSNDTTATRVSELVYDGLVELDEDLVPQPSLAESWESNEDGTTYTFHLKEGVEFHDGEPFTAEDVKYTYETILDESYNAPNRSLYDPIEEVNVIDDYTVEIVTSEPYAPLLSYANIGIVPAHLGDEEGFSNNPVGTGPYEMVEWKRGSEIHFEGNDSYFDGEPHVSEVIFYIIPDNTTRVSALEAGDIDFLHSPVSPQDIERISDNDNFVLHQETGLGHTYLNFNFDDPLISNEAIRKAIASVVNKETIANDIYEGMDEPGVSPLLPSSWAFSEEIQDYAYDTEEAIKFLEEDGWKENDSGVREKDGETLSLVLKTHTEDPNRMQAIEYIQFELQEIGFDVSVETEEWASFQQSLQTGNFQVALLGWLNLVDPDRAMYNQFHTEGGSNYGSYSNEEVDKLLEEGRTTLDQETRADLYEEAASIITEEVSYDVLLYQGYIVMHTSDLEGYTVHPGAQFRSIKDITLN